MQENSHLWEQPFTANDDMVELEKIMTNSCRKIIKWGHTDFVEDDDKLRFRSFSSSKDFGWTRSKGVKSFGPVFNIVAHTPMGHFVAGTMTKKGESTCNTTKRMLLRMTNQEEPSGLDLHGAMFEGDRGYNDDSFHEFITNVNANPFNTVKRSPKQLFNWGNTKFRANREQKIVSEQGPRTVFAAKRKINNKEQCQVLFRSGTGRCVLLSTTQKEMEFNNWTITFKSENDRFGFISGSFMEGQQLQDKIVIDSHAEGASDGPPPLSNQLRQLTEGQRDQLWSTLRQMKFSSTTAYRSIQIMPKSQLGS